VKWVFQTRFGSHVYGTNVATSDTDIKAIIIPDSKELLLQRAPRTIVQTTKSVATARNQPEDVDTEIFALHRYLELLMEGQTVALDMLFTPNQFWTSGAHPAWDAVRRYKDYFLHSGTTAFVGYCRQQANKYGIKGSRIAAVRKALDLIKTLDPRSKLRDYEEAVRNLCTDEHTGIVELRAPNGKPEPYLEIVNRKLGLSITCQAATDILQRIFDQYGARALLAEKNDSVDWKALMHAVRVAEQAKELLLTGQITFPRPEAQLLLRIRKGELPYKQVAELIEQGLAEIESVKAQSVLRAEPDREMADALVLDAYGDEVRSWLDPW
jgi:hypothetical protein